MNKPYHFNETVLHLLCESLQKHYVGKMTEITDAYILSSPENSPILVIKAKLEDGTIIRTDRVFFEDE